MYHQDSNHQSIESILTNLQVMEGASNKFSFAMRGIFLFSLLLVLCPEPSSGQFFSGIMDCLKKVNEACSGLRMDPLPTDPKSSNLRVTCCSSAAVTRCMRRQAAQYCPSIPIDSLLNLAQTVSSNTACPGYDFWSPECLYTNFMIEILGAGAATGVILLLLIILCCCCCRSKK